MNRRAFLGVAGASMAGVAGCLGRTEYTVTDVSVGEHEAPVEFGVSVTEPRAVVEHPARLQVSVTNTSGDDLSIRNTGIWPFGLLELATAPDEAQPGSGPILWTERYGESEHVDAESRSSYGTDATALVEGVSPGETRSEDYELHGDDIIRAGTYYLRGEFEPPIFAYRRRETRDWQPFDPEVRVTVEARELL
jgi:hypothetical protein